MKNLKVFFTAMFMLTIFSVSAEAQVNNVGQLLSGLINVNIEDVQVDITTGDISVINVENVLNNSEIRILNNVLNNSPIASNNSEILTNLLRDADILNENQVVVGVLSSGQIVFQEL